MDGSLLTYMRKDMKEGYRVEIITRFDPETANKAHAGTILASGVLPKGLNAPFEHAWGYLNGPGEMEPQSFCGRRSGGLFEHRRRRNAGSESSI